jgi:hypothetical protein
MTDAAAPADGPDLAASCARRAAHAPYGLLDCTLT